MPTRSITVVWKIPKPAGRPGRDLRNLAITAALEADPDAVAVLVRSRIHSTTLLGDTREPDRPHLTISTKNEDQVAAGTHSTAHGYVEREKPIPSEVTDIGYSKYYETEDSFLVRGDPIWPYHLPRETVSVEVA